LGCLFPAMVTSSGYPILWENGGHSARLPNLPRHCMSDPSSSFSRIDAIGGKVLLDSHQISREGL
jgi:hypothetical protein